MIGKAKKVYGAVTAGERPLHPDGKYNVLIVSAEAKSRMTVRAWDQMTLEMAYRNVLAWFEDLRFGRFERYYRFNSILSAIFQHEMEHDGKISSKVLWKAVPSQYIVWLFQTAIRGSPLPDWTISMVLQRISSTVFSDDEMGKKLLPRQLGVLKAYLSRKGDRNLMPTLNRSHPSPVYHAGRLLKVLEALQAESFFAANKKCINASLTSKYFMTAMTSPAAVIPQLLGESRHHLKTLERDGAAGRAKRYDEIIKDVYGSSVLSDGLFAKRLTQAEKGLFCLGFFQETDEIRAETEQKE